MAPDSEAEPSTEVNLLAGTSEQIDALFVRLGIQPEIALLARGLLLVVGVIFLAFLANWAAKRVLLRVLDKVVGRFPARWLAALRDNRVFLRLSHLAPAAVLNFFARSLSEEAPFAAGFLQGVVALYVVIVLLLVISAVITTLQKLFESGPAGSMVPVKGFAQALKLIVFLVGGVFILSILFDQSPVYFLSGIGALTAVMLLVFRDALLGLVAGVMISVNQMVRVGDWIEMPAAGADGDVIDVSLTTVKVRNWDRTITTIPSYDLISKSFKNWRGMFENKGRRIKRPILIDLQTIRFLQPEELERLLRIQRIQPYLKGKLAEIAAEQPGDSTIPDDPCGARRLTNIGTFRAYCLAYLKEHPGIYQQELMIVRQLNPAEHGLPLEIYAFTNDTRWVAYEGIQSDIFDHLLSILPEFGLRVFQEPSGADWRARGSDGTTAGMSPGLRRQEGAPKDSSPSEA